MQKIIIKHLVGSKANQTETFELPIQEIIIGRDSSCQVVFDPEKDDLVSRLHCKITFQNENQFLLTDLHSRNGTFVNNVKITSPQQLNPTDQVELGKGGTKFAFDLDPRPQTAPKATRLGDTISPVGTTREVRIDSILESVSSDKPEQNRTTKSTFDSSKSASIGRNTVERLITQVESNSRKKMINIGAGIIGIIVLISGYFVFQSHQDKAKLEQIIVEEGKVRGEQFAAQKAEQAANKISSSSDIFKEFGDSTVLIESSWKLTHLQTGKQIFQKLDCFPKGCTTAKMPWYIFINGTVEPLLVLDDGKAIGGYGAGSGFVVDESGFILTNRHVAASWHTQSRDFSLPGILVICGDNTCNDSKAVILPDDPSNKYVASLNNWVPSKSKMLGKKPLQGKLVEGRNDVLDITFPKTGLRIPGRLVRVSDTADVALIKIDVPQKIKPVDMSSDDRVEPGTPITVMGYPGISPDVSVQMNSQDPFNREGEWRQIPEPTVTGGNIGKVIEGSAKTISDSVNGYFSEMGDVYQLTVNATGSGNSGGPVFNDKGHVIGIFTSKKTDQAGTNISFAVPIKHGQEIMGIHQLVQ